MVGSVVSVVCASPLCDGSDRVDPHTTSTCAASDPCSTEATQRACPLIGSPQCLREAQPIKGDFPQPQGKRIGRRFPEESTREWTEPSEDDHEGEGAEDARSPWAASRPEPTPSQSRPWDEDRWPRGARV
ncbi:hypothetical protein NDU88_001966 [Pleurodeles waltl]|uniref:Uncharacterized protein n=1 Tax=Pleurodeles waltl TaxID=8319 RepID=A0AAV7M1Z7_PLEWA|nr:hypothetical protein NDU88_001966 [Pleurodeles waltl]